MRPDIIYSSDADELSDDDYFDSEELRGYAHNIISAEEEGSLFQNTILISTGSFL